MKIFLHIPKTAGVTVREIISARLELNEIFHIADPSLVNASFKVPEGTKFLHGHLNISQVHALGVQSSIYTFLRDPLERAISLYHFINSGAYSITNVTKKQRDLNSLIKTLSIEEYLVSNRNGVRNRVRNAQLSFLSGGASNAELEPADRYTVAVNTLDSCRFVGIVEEMEKSLKLLAVIEGVPPATSVVRNSTKRSNLSLSEEIVRKFKKRNKYEYKIYNYARQRMNMDYEKAIHSLITNNYLNKLILRPQIERLDYDFSMSLEGDGWHTRETNGKIYWRFTGPGERACLYFPGFSKRPKNAIFQVVNSVTPEHIARLQVLINGVPLVRENDHGMSVHFSIPEKALDHPYTHIEIVTPPAKQPGELDDRKIGIAFSAITIS